MKRELEKLSTTARDLFSFVNEFGKLHNVIDEVTKYFSYDQIQKKETDKCGVFQLYFYKDLFVPYYESLIMNNEKLTKKTVQKLLKKNICGI